jgi:hypothetical protein
VKTPNLRSDPGTPNPQWRQRWTMVIVDLETGHDVRQEGLEASLPRQEVERRARLLADSVARAHGRPAATFGYRLEVGEL